MNPDLAHTKIFIKPGATDLRKAVNGLSILIQEEMYEQPLSGTLFMFCNKSRKLIKVIWWDKTGFWLCQKKLEKAAWPWPESEEKVQQLSTDELHMLLKGIDFWKAHKPLYYSRVI